mmetsp:Transcript_58382/g.92709  ORF Transcript_58382/g.92709 Transcript_58382/m.92709 type:complete len:224 (+) Transcript_58382:56-727(+)
MVYPTNIVACLFVCVFDSFNANRDVLGIWTSTEIGKHALASLLLTLQPSLHLSHVRLGGEKAQRFQPAQLAGFGKPKEAAKPLPAEPKKQWDVFKRIMKKEKALGKNGRNAVFCRLKGETKWGHVGDIAISKDASVAAAVQLHKDLIRKHAGRVFAKMTVGEIEIAYTEAPFEDQAEKIMFEDGVAPAALKECGFEGEADASGHYKRITLVDASKIDATRELS